MKKRSANSFNESQAPVEVPPPIPAFSLTGALSPLLLVPMALPVLVALFAPDDILDLWPWARNFTAWVQRMVPFLNMSAHANSTVFPQVALLAHSFMVFLIPLLSLVWLWQSIVNYPYLLSRRRILGRLSIKQHVIAILAVPVFLGAVWAFVALPGDPSFATGFTTNGRHGFALLTLFLLYPGTMLLGAQLACFRLFIDTYIKQGT